MRKPTTTRRLGVGHGAEDADDLVDEGGGLVLAHRGSVRMAIGVRSRVRALVLPPAHGTPAELGLCVRRLWPVGVVPDGGNRWGPLRLCRHGPKLTSQAWSLRALDVTTFAA
jgi:hypothetical protein